MSKPVIVCLCGSTQFLAQERASYLSETLAGRIVLSHSGVRMFNKETGGALDQLHFRKIDLADEILVLNVGGYIGDSTRNEIAYAQKHGKRVRWLEGDVEDQIHPAVLSERERCATAAESFKGGFTANVRTDEDEPELVRDPDGPWGLNSDIAKVIRENASPLPRKTNTEE